MRDPGLPTYRQLPAVGRLLDAPELGPLIRRHGRKRVRDAARKALLQLRQQIRAQRTGAPPEPQGGGETLSVAATPLNLLPLVESTLAADVQPSLRRVLNGTGVILHTNLGRAPLPASAVTAVLDVARGYSSLEYDLRRGGRGTRDIHVEARIVGLVGAERAMAVNNCASALLLALSALCRGGEVIVSRGELVEIGGGFRIPDILRESGADLVEVGTTNKVRADDYRRALSPRTRAILRVHRANFALVGFTSEPSLPALKEIARQNSIPLLVDLGSGLLAELKDFCNPSPAFQAFDGGFDGDDNGGFGDRFGGRFGERFGGRFGDDVDTVEHTDYNFAQHVHEPKPERVLEEGADLVMMSGDKLLGGPQAGIIAGRGDLVERMKAHPLARALRADKMTLAALEATLRLYEQDRLDEIPTLRMLRESAESVRARALAIRDGICASCDVPVVVESSTAVPGGGSLPMTRLPSSLVLVGEAGAAGRSLARALREGDPPLITRMVRDRVGIDARTIEDESVSLIPGLVTNAMQRINVASVDGASVDGAFVDGAFADGAFVDDAFVDDASRDRTRREKE